jgi:hypothetical protein
MFPTFTVKQFTIPTFDELTAREIAVHERIISIMAEPERHGELYQCTQEEMTALIRVVSCHAWYGKGERKVLGLLMYQQLQAVTR